MEVTTNSTNNETAPPLTAKDYLKRGKKVLDSSPWTGVGDAGLSDFQNALALVACGSTTTTTSSHDDGDDDGDDDCAELYFHEGLAFQKLKHWRDSLKPFHQALRILESTVGRYDDSTTRAYMHIGMSYDGIDARKFAKHKYQAAARIERHKYGDNGLWDVQALLGSQPLSPSLDLELRGDYLAIDSNMELARQTFKEAIYVEHQGFGGSANANLVLLHRKVVVPTENVFDCTSCRSVCNGDDLYFDGEYLGAIAAYKAARGTCDEDTTEVGGTLEDAIGARGTCDEGAIAWWGLLILFSLVFGKCLEVITRRMVQRRTAAEFKKTDPSLKNKSSENALIPFDISNTFAGLPAAGNQTKTTSHPVVSPEETPVALATAHPKATSPPRHVLSHEEENREIVIAAVNNLKTGLQEEPSTAVEPSNWKATPPRHVLTQEENREIATHDLFPTKEADEIVQGIRGECGDIVIDGDESDESDDGNNKDLMDSACERVGAIMGRDPCLEWSFQPTSDEDDVMPESLSKTLFGK
jgi:tetratricopeptide (TPR) repeat protein